MHNGSRPEWEHHIENWPLELSSFSSLPYYFSTQKHTPVNNIHSTPSLQVFVVFWSSEFSKLAASRQNWFGGGVFKMRFTGNDILLGENLRITTIFHSFSPGAHYREKRTRGRGLLAMTTTTRYISNNTNNNNNSNDNNNNNMLTFLKIQRRCLTCSC